jgi:hypothetical protein
MRFTSEQRLDDGVLAREFILGEIPGTLWTPESAAPAPLILMAHNNGLPKGESRLVARARHSAAYGYAVAAIDAPGCGDRPRSAAGDRFPGARSPVLRSGRREGIPSAGSLPAVPGAAIRTPDSSSRRRTRSALPPPSSYRRTTCSTGHPAARKADTARMIGTLGRGAGPDDQKGGVRPC